MPCNCDEPLSCGAATAISAKNRCCWLNSRFFLRSSLRSQFRRCAALSEGGDEGFSWDNDEYGPYPWEAFDDNPVEWVQEDTITLFTSEGLVRIGGSKVPRRSSSSTKKRQRLRRFREEDYMDPKQELCLGALFDIAATNGLDLSRRVCILGFCRSVEMLSDVVEDSVHELGGEVVIAAKLTSGDLHEKLKMRVAIPLLWGIPPGLESLNHAIRSGGGIVERAFYRWEFF